MSVFALLVSWLLGLNSSPEEVLVLRSSQLSPWLMQTSLNTLMEPEYGADPAAIAALNSYLNTLERLGLDPSQQGVWVQSGTTVWAANEGTVPLSAASLTKLVTSLAALHTWGTDHQFETLVSITGVVRNGVLEGDLLIQGGGDPLYVWEEAIALANVLQQNGIQEVAGELLIAGNFSMNYQDDPIKSGTLLKQAFNARLWPAEAEAQYLQMPPGTPRPTLRIQGPVRFTSPNALQARQPRPLFKHYSLPLAQLVKLMNIYSNNVMAQQLADLLGGAEQAAKIAATTTHVPQEEIQIINGSGLGQENQISARAISRILMAMNQHVKDTPWTLADLLPVSGRDVGTLAGRQLPLSAAVKTGSLWSVSSLAGAFPTQDQGIVWFAIINRGSNLDQLREQQDVILNAFVEHWGEASLLPADLQPSLESLNPANQLGASSRIQPVDNMAVTLP
ncbi:MAG: D-alanyl-D-alanine carboxypeptidase [Leptolyngbyaceae bacterium]|nr:D-alanyl-D-alanine carboxypeptidase [Leptolyngbyaceae bacterium]